MKAKVIKHPAVVIQKRGDQLITQMNNIVLEKRGLALMEVLRKISRDTDEFMFCMMNVPPHLIEEDEKNAEED